MFREGDLPVKYLPGSYSEFSAWRRTAREKLKQFLLYNPPSIPFDPIIIGEED